MIMTSELQPKINDLVSIAKRIVTGELDIIEGCRLINDLRWDLDNDGLDNRFDYFVQFEMKCYSIPPTESRSRWSESVLEKYDTLANQLRSEHTNDFFAECKQLIASYETTA